MADARSRRESGEARTSMPPEHRSSGISHRNVRLASGRMQGGYAATGTGREAKRTGRRAESARPATLRASSASTERAGAVRRTAAPSGRSRTQRRAAQPSAIANLFGAIVDTIRDALQGGARHDAHPRERGHGHGHADQLHTTFRSGSAASTVSSLRSQGASSVLERGRYGSGPSSVIGHTLRRGQPSFSRGRGRNRGRGYGRAGGWRSPAARPLSAASIAVPAAALFLVLFLVGSVVSTTPAGIEPAQESSQLNIGTLTPSQFPVSTPVSQWEQGEMPHLYQTDAAWCNLPYGGGTVAQNACGPTAMTMLYVYFTGNTDMDPGTMSSWADANNYAPTGATEWSFMTEAAYAFGFYAEMVAPTRQTVESALRQGNPVICVVGAGDFTMLGHYIILKSIDERGMVEIYDPNSPDTSARKWDLVRVLNQADVAWVYSAA